MFWPQQPYIIVQPQSNPPPISQGVTPPADPVETLKRQAESLTSMAQFFEEMAKKKKDDKPKTSQSSADWKALAQLLFWTSPLTGLAMLHVYAALYKGFLNGMTPFIK